MTSQVAKGLRYAFKGYMYLYIILFLLVLNCTSFTKSDSLIPYDIVFISPTSWS